jgi:hypothetical protein
VEALSLSKFTFPFHVRGNFFRQEWDVLSNDKTMQIVAYIEVCMVLMVAM